MNATTNIYIVSFRGHTNLYLCKRTKNYPTYSDYTARVDHCASEKYQWNMYTCVTKSSEGAAGIQIITLPTALSAEKSYNIKRLEYSTTDYVFKRLHRADQMLGVNLITLSYA